MNVEELQDPEVFQKVKEAWGQELCSVRDDRRRWARGWHRVKIVMKEARKKRAEKRKSEATLAQEVEWCRIQLASGSLSEDEARECGVQLEEARKRLKDQELWDARMWRLRSRENWLKEDEVTSRFFFAKLKSKWAKESIHALEMPDGEVSSDKEEILEEIHRFFQVLYTAEAETTEQREASEELLATVRNKLSVEESMKVSVKPEAEEIKAVVFAMKANKSPGLDGLTIEGCPLAPLLFAICSQPLMGAIAKAEAEGAKINIQKSLVMPLGKTQVPEWVRELGCDVVEGGRSFRYLGVQLGVDLRAGADVEVAITKMKARIFSWENMYLTWGARMLLIKHILSQIPMHIMLTVGSVQVEAARLEKVCREFLWGSSTEGKPKKALIAWRKIAREKRRGALGITAFEDKAKALQMRHVCSLLKGKPVEWVRIARRLIRFKLRNGPQKQERAMWECEDAMLLLNSWRCEELPSIDMMLQRRPPTAGFSWLEQEARRCNVRTMSELQCAVEEGKGVAQILVHSFPEVHHWITSLTAVDKSLTELQGWSWKSGWRVEKEWKASVKEWLIVMKGPGQNLGFLSRRWLIDHDEDEWTWRWRRLWQGRFAMRDKIWVWRLIHDGFPTLERARKWGVSDGICGACQRETETMEHIVWRCSERRDQISWIAEVLAGRQIGFPRLLMVIDECLMHNQKGSMKLFLLVEHSRMCWRERNARVFSGEKVTWNEEAVIAAVTSQGTAFSKTLKGDKQKEFMEDYTQFLERARGCIAEWRARRDNVRRIMQDLGEESDSEPNSALRPADSGRDEESETTSTNTSDDSQSNSSNEEFESEDDRTEVSTVRGIAV
ncbi:hypothetical protein R1sor_009042 [Riccia sorocarpa]|uniref:Reverse transcriptase zinc-binding domain-containing protein n=1 Tax=Riccia sorocarpa TaxID=122646 RepID=A0ABD3H593_9MARC